MVATPLPDSGDLHNPSRLFCGKTYEGKENPVSHKFGVSSGNPYQLKKDVATDCGDSTHGKTVQFDVSKEEKENQNDTVKNSRTMPLFQRSKSVPADTTPAKCADVLLQIPSQKPVGKRERLDIRDSGQNDSAHTPLLSLEGKDESAESDEKARVCSKVNMNSESCKVIVPSEYSDNDTKKDRKKTLKLKYVLVPIVVLLIVLGVGVGLAIYFGNQIGGENTTTPTPITSSPVRKCNVYETTVNNAAVAVDEIKKNSAYTVPFKIFNTSFHDIYTKDGRHFRVTEPGYYDVHLTLHLDAYSWIEPEDFDKRYLARLCAVVGASKAHCVTSTLVAKDRDSIAINRKILFESVNDNLRFTIRLDDAKMLKKSKRDNVLQLHRLSKCDSYHTMKSPDQGHLD